MFTSLKFISKVINYMLHDEKNSSLKLQKKKIRELSLNLVWLLKCKEDCFN